MVNTVVWVRHGMQLCRRRKNHSRHGFLENTENLLERQGQRSLIKKYAVAYNLIKYSWQMLSDGREAFWDIFLGKMDWKTEQ